MSTNLQFFLARVAQAREEAEAATLDHVRERCRRSEAAWSALAERAERSEQMRTLEASRKAELTAAEMDRDRFTGNAQHLRQSRASIGEAGEHVTASDRAIGRSRRLLDERFDKGFGEGDPGGD